MTGLLKAKINFLLRKVDAWGEIPARTCPDRKQGSGRPARLLSVSDLTPSPYFLHGDGFGVARVWVTGQGSDAQGLRRRTWGVGDERPADVREPGGGCLPAGVSPGAFARDPRGPTQEARHTQSLGPPSGPPFQGPNATHSRAGVLKGSDSITARFWQPHPRTQPRQTRHGAAWQLCRRTEPRPGRAGRRGSAGGGAGMEGP